MGLFSSEPDATDEQPEDRPEVFDDKYWDGVDAGGHSWGTWGK